MIAQLGGIWYGELENDSTHKKQNFEVGLSEYRGKITGYTYTTFIENDTFYYSIKRIKAEKKDGFLIITDDEMVGNNFPQRAAKGVRQTTVFPLINDSTFDITKGTWSTNQTRRYYSLKGSAKVSEQQERDQSDLIAHLDEMKVKTDITVKNPVKKVDESVAKNKPEERKSEPVKQTNSLPAVNKEEVIQKPPVATSEPTKTTTETKPIVATVNKPEETVQKPSVAASGPMNTKPEMSRVIQTPDKPIGNNATTNRQPVTQTAAVIVNTNSPAQNKTNYSTQNTAAQRTQSTPINNPVTSSKPATTAPVVVRQQTPTQSPGVQKTTQPVSIDKAAMQKTTAVQSPKKDSLAAQALPTVVATRKSETIQNLYFHGDSLVLSLYDNGVVDGDTVSVFVNGNAFISKQQLKISAFKKTVYITPDMDSVQIVLFADNLGSIPPNTGLLTVRDGEQTYQVRFSADLKKNAAILLSRKK